MHARHLIKPIVALVVAATSVGLLGAPASANDAELTSGSFEIYGSDSNLLFQRDWSDTTGDTECSTSSKDFTLTTPTHAWGFTSDDHFSRIFAGTSYTVERTFTSGGTSSSGGTMSGTATLLVELRTNNGSTCTPTTGTLCLVTVTNIVLSGTHTMTAGISASDTATLSGNSGDHGAFEFNLSVTGNCGALSIIDDGSVVFSNLGIHVTT